MFITLLDFSKIRLTLAKLNRIVERPQVTNLLRIYNARYSKKENTGELQKAANNLNLIMDYNIEHNLPLHKNLESYLLQSYTFKLDQSLPKNEELSYLIRTALAFGLEDYISIDGKKMINILTDDDAACPVMKASEVINFAKRFVHLKTAVKYVWVNICGNNIFQGDLIIEEREVLKTFNRYFCGEINTYNLYSNFRLQDFISGLGVKGNTISVEYNYIKMSMTYKLESSELPLSLSSRLNNYNVTVIAKTPAYQRLLDGINMTESYYDIVYVEEQQSKSDKWKSKFILANSFYEGRFTDIKYVPWPDENIAALNMRIERTISRVDHVWISAGKGIGKSVLKKRMSPSYFVIDSDVKGKFLFLISKDEEILQLLKDDPLNSRILTLFYACCIDVNDTILSIYEQCAVDYIAENNITVDTILTTNCNTLYHKFIQIYNAVSKPIGSDKNVFFKLSGSMLAFHNLTMMRGDLPSLKYTKVIQFTHNANELYGAMSDAIYSINSTINTVPIHLRRARKYPPVVQLFLSEFYTYTDTFTTTPVTLSTLFSILADRE